MQRWIIPPSENMIEPAIAPVIYANGKPAVEWLGNGDVCFYMTQKQLPLECAGGEPQSIVVAHVIKPICDLPMVIMAFSECLQWHLCEHSQGPVCPARPPPGQGRLKLVW